MMAGHSLHKLQLVPYVHKQEKNKSTDPSTEESSGGIHNLLMLTKYTVV